MKISISSFERFFIRRVLAIARIQTVENLNRKLKLGIFGNRGTRTHPVIKARAITVSLKMDLIRQLLRPLLTK